MRVTERSLLRIFGLFVVAFLLWLSFQATAPNPGRPKVGFGVLGYTNGADGTRLAIVAITNLDAVPIFAYQPHVGDTDPQRDYWSLPMNWHSNLSRGEWASFTIAPPTNYLRWTVSALVYNDMQLSQMIQRTFFGIPRRMAFSIQSGWFDSEKPPLGSP